MCMLYTTLDIIPKLSNYRNGNNSKSNQNYFDISSKVDIKLSSCHSSLSIPDEIVFFIIKTLHQT